MGPGCRPVSGPVAVTRLQSHCSDRPQKDGLDHGLWSFFGGIYPYPFSPPLHRLSFSKEGRGRERKWCWSTRKQPGSWFLLLCNVRGSNRGEKTTFLFSACPRFEPGTARIVHEAQPSRPGCHIFLAHNLTDHNNLTDHIRMFSTKVCGPIGGIYPYPFSTLSWSSSAPTRWETSRGATS